jgi:hypothetical protein
MSARLIKFACGACFRTIVLLTPVDLRNYAEKDGVPSRVRFRMVACDTNERRKAPLTPRAKV